MPKSEPRITARRLNSATVSSASTYGLNSAGGAVELHCRFAIGHASSILNARCEMRMKPEDYISHTFVVWAASAFGRDPVDDLVGVGDVAGFAVDAIGGVDLQFGGTFLGDHFVDGRGTKILAGVAVFADAAVDADIRFENDQVAGLIFLMARAGMVDVGEAVEGELAVTFVAQRLIDEMRGAVAFFVFLVARLAEHGVDQAATAGNELQAGLNETGNEAAVKGLMEIANFPQFFFDPAFIELARVGGEDGCRGVAFAEGFVNGFGGEHAGFNGGVDAFQALGIQYASGIADDEAAVDVIARHGIPAAVGDGFRAVTDELAAF